MELYQKSIHGDCYLRDDTTIYVEYYAAWKNENDLYVLTWKDLYKRLFSENGCLLCYFSREK